MSSEIPRILHGHREVTVHSVFGSAVNLRAGQRLLNCSAGAISVPYGIEMAPADLGRLQRLGCTASLDVVEWGPLEGAIALRAGGVVFASTSETVVFDTALTTGHGTDMDASTRELVAYLARVRARTGLGVDWMSMTNDAALVGAVASLAGGRADDAVLQWMGRGPGLTPSGDDVLVGMVAALWFTGAVDSPGLAALRRVVETSGRRLTTDISAEYLHYACRAMVAGTVRDVLVALDRSDTSGVVRTVEQLRRHGDTSGCDCLLGVVVALLSAPRGGCVETRLAA